MNASAGPLFDDGKDAGAMRTIGEVADALDIRQHVLRYWEQQFPMLKPLKRSGGRRYYRPEDIRLVETIDRLVNREGYTLRGARLALEAGEPASRAATQTAAPKSLASAVAAPDVLPQLKAIRARLAAALDG